MQRSCLLPLLVFIMVAVTPALCAGAPRTVHVVVALCDNVYQRIMPVPPRLGNGDDPAQNLYWGAAYGVKTFMRKQPGWKLAHTDKNPAPHILERVVFQNSGSGVTMVADAYQGKAIKEATIDFLAYASGQKGLDVPLGAHTLKAGGFAALIVYIGHNGLMDFSVDTLPPAQDIPMRSGIIQNEKRSTASPSAQSTPMRSGINAAIFACQSKPYFEDILKKTGAHPLIWTRGNMAPEAYGLHALVTAWAKGEKNAAVREAVARAYDKYQKCGIRGARNLFATGW